MSFQQVVLGNSEALDLVVLEPALAAERSDEVLLIGCGTSMAFIDPDLREAARAA